MAFLGLRKLPWRVAVPLMVTASVLIPAGSDAVVASLTLTGDTTFIPGLQALFSGKISAPPRGDGVPVATVELLVDGAVATTTQTNSQGIYHVALALDSSSGHTIQTVAFRNTPAEIVSEPHWIGVAPRRYPVSIEAGGNHTCAVLSDRTAVCWGSNSQGQLGDGTTTSRPDPAPVEGLTSVDSISLGGAHTCALLLNRTVRCWGRNTSGQLGDGSTTQRETAVSASELNDVVEIQAGVDFTCGLLADGSIRCWGYGGDGQLGTGWQRSVQTTPVQVSDISDANQISAGLQHACALLSEGVLMCWGFHQFGESGYSLVPVVVETINGATGIATGASHSCLKESGGRVQCWGNGERGQMGNGYPLFGAEEDDVLTSRPLLPVRSSSSPEFWPILTETHAIASGSGHTCAVAYRSRLGFCWGSNSSGQIGFSQNPMSFTNVALPVRSISHLTNMTAGFEHTCALTVNGRAYCWGKNVEGQLGGPWSNPQHFPLEVAGLE